MHDQGPPVMPDIAGAVMSAFDGLQFPMHALQPLEPMRNAAPGLDRVSSPAVLPTWMADRQQSNALASSSSGRNGLAKVQPPCFLTVVVVPDDIHSACMLHKGLADHS